MGTYTHFEFNATLKKDTPKDLQDYVQTRLTYIEGSDGPESVPYNSHPFFSCYRWGWVLTYYNCNDNGLKAWCKETDNGLVIHIDTTLKNYCSSIEWFLIFIAPYVDTSYDCTMVKYVEDYYDQNECKQDAKELIERIQSKLLTQLDTPTLSLYYGD